MPRTQGQKKNAQDMKDPQPPLIDEQTLKSLASKYKKWSFNEKQTKLIQMEDGLAAKRKRKDADVPAWEAEIRFLTDATDVDTRTLHPREWRLDPQRASGDSTGVTAHGTSVTPVEAAKEEKGPPRGDRGVVLGEGQSHRRGGRRDQPHRQHGGAAHCMLVNMHLHM